MKISIQKKKTPIQTVKDWERLAPPQGKERQWKCGHSAKLLAEYATSEAFAPEIADILRSCDIPTQDFTCEPEVCTGFPSKDFGTGGPRHHDLLMVGDKDCIIGVEAKVDESLGNPIRQEIKNASDNKRKRVLGLVNFLDDKTRTDVNALPDSIQAMRYQLYTTTVATLLEAKKQGKKTAVVLVLSLIPFDAKSLPPKATLDHCKLFAQLYFPKGKAIIDGISCHFVHKIVTVASDCA